MTKNISPARCATAPCKSCPYREDVPSGVWSADEYEKLPGYDGEIIEQLQAGATAMFNCHQRDGHLCAGWVAVHDMDNNMAVRMAGMRGEDIDPMIFDYVSPVPLFASGAEAAEHGMRDIDYPSREANVMVERLERMQRRERRKRERSAQS